MVSENSVNLATLAWYCVTMAVNILITFVGLCSLLYIKWIQMKTIKLVVLGLVMAFAGAVQSQISVNVHIGSAPVWGPRGYEHARYYYLPDVEAYYDVKTAMFIYISGNAWIRRSYLPSRYQHYNLYRGRKVVMNNYHGNSPYYNHKFYRSKYGQGQAPLHVTMRNKIGNSPSSGKAHRGKKGNGKGRK